METWDMLVPRYVTPIVGLWYTPLGLVFFIFSFPLFFFLTLLTALGTFYFPSWCFFVIRRELRNLREGRRPPEEGKPREEPSDGRGRGFRRLHVLLSRMFRKVPQDEEPFALFPWIRKRDAFVSIRKALLLLGINIVYVYFHWLLTKDPAVLAQGDPQGLSATDFEWVRWFLGGFAGTGIALMIWNVGTALSLPADRLIDRTKPERCLVLTPCHENDRGQHIELKPQSDHKGVIDSDGKLQCLGLHEPGTGHLLQVCWDDKKGWAVEKDGEQKTRVYVSQAKSGVTCKRLEGEPMRLDDGDVIWWRVPSGNSRDYHSFEAKLIL